MVSTRQGGGAACGAGWMEPLQGWAAGLAAGPTANSPIEATGCSLHLQQLRGGLVHDAGNPSNLQPKWFYHSNQKHPPTHTPPAAPR